MDYVVRFASTTEDRNAAFELRRSVFELEQNVPRPLDRDSHDLNADHAVVLDSGGHCVGTGRIVRLDSRTCQIGRMAVVAVHRRCGVGSAALETLERMAALRGIAELVVHAQLPSEPFFRSRGYVTEGAVFLEHGVPHVVMRKWLVP